MITTGLPFAGALLLMTFCLFKGLRRERIAKTEEVTSSVAPERGE
ncbi:hypothetical protein [Haloferula sp. A504]